MRQRTGKITVHRRNRAIDVVLKAGDVSVHHPKSSTLEREQIPEPPPMRADDPLLSRHRRGSWSSKRQGIANP